jgi:anti-sigma regulatory factor (Ser/Thr protein kinase)
VPYRGSSRGTSLRPAASPRAMRGAWTLDSSSERVWLLPPDPTAAGLARRHVEDICRGLPEADLDTARLVATELVSNAVKHGTGSPALGIVRDGTAVLVYVEDESHESPFFVESTEVLEHGAGMRLVAALANEWGIAPRGDGLPGKRVWAAVT